MWAHYLPSSSSKERMAQPGTRLHAVLRCGEQELHAVAPTEPTAAPKWVKGASAKVVKLATTKKGKLSNELLVWDETALNKLSIPEFEQMLKGYLAYIRGENPLFKKLAAFLVFDATFKYKGRNEQGVLYVTEARLKRSIAGLATHGEGVKESMRNAVQDGTLTQEEFKIFSKLRRTQLKQRNRTL